MRTQSQKNNKQMKHKTKNNNNSKLLTPQERLELLQAKFRQQTQQIFVNTISGKTLPLFLKADTTVLGLKEALMNYECVLPEDQRLSFAGKELLEDPDKQKTTTLPAKQLKYY